MYKCNGCGSWFDSPSRVCGHGDCQNDGECTTCEYEIDGCEYCGSDDFKFIRED